MRKRYKVKLKKRSPAYARTWRVLSALFLLCLLIRAVSSPLQARADELSRRLSSSGTAETLLRLELGDMPKYAESPALAALFLSTGLRGAEDSGAPEIAVPPAEKAPDTLPKTSYERAAPVPDSAPDAVFIPDVPDAVETTITGEGGGYQSAADGIFLKNKTDYDINVTELLASPLSPDIGSRVLIIHTHGSEAYTPDGDDNYVASDPYRTEDKSFSVIRVGDELERVLTEHGVSVIHDREIYDYPSYNGSYNRAYDAICAYQEKYPDISVVIDLHRDALESADGTVYKTVADIGDTPCAQVLLIVGTDFSGLEHPNWRENLKFALRLQAEMVLEYPTLARPLSVSQYRYNQHATAGSLIAEVGCNGNTLEEAVCAAGYFGECLGNVLEKAK